MTTLVGPPLHQAEGIGALTLGGFLEEVGIRFAANEALVFDDPLRDGATTRWSYGDLWGQARRVAKALIAHGLEPGGRVGVLMGNRPEAVAAIFASVLAGGVVVPLSTFAPAAELAFMAADAEVTILLTQARLLGRHPVDDVTVSRPKLPRLGTVAAVGDSSWDRLLTAGGDIGNETLDRRQQGTRPDDQGLITYSSGTTSRPKGIVHAHRAPVLQSWVQGRIFRRSETTRLWTAFPLFWSAGFNSVLGATLAAGGCWVMQETFDAGGALALMAREQVNEPYCLPHQTAALVEHPDWAGADLSSLTAVFGKSALARHPTVTGDPTWNMPVGYGLSETCAFFSAHPADTPRALLKTSMGPLLPGNQLRVIDPDTGQTLPAGHDGELAVKGPTLMSHYVGLSPQECFDTDGFFHTGDMGSFDDDGFLHFAGRRTEMIKTGGANVSPAELEVALRACAPVKLARVLGVADPRLDQIVVACIVVADGAEVDAGEIQAFLRQRVAAYKVPKRVLFFAEGEIPMTNSDTKVRDDGLLDLVERRLGGEAPERSTAPAPSTVASDPPVPSKCGDR